MRGGRILKVLKRLALGTAITLVVLIAVAYAWYHLTLYKKAPAQEDRLALTGVTALVGERLERRSGTTILIRDGVIVGIEEDRSADVPADAVRIDLSGYTVLPGLIDVHVHLGGPEMELGEEPGPAQIADLILEWLRFAPGARRAFLEHGVTAVRDLGNSYDWVTDLRERLRHGELEGPRLFAAGPLFTTPGGHPVVTIFANDPAGARDSTRLPGSAEEARRMVRELAGGKHPVDVIKVVQERGSPERGRPMQPIDPDVLQAIVAEAHEHGLRVFAHWGTLQDLTEVLAAGVDGLEHTGRPLFDGWPDEVLAVLLERDVSMTPTLAVAAMRMPPEATQAVKQQVREFAAAGGHVLAGSDVGMPGIRIGDGLHRELELLVDSGLTPREALVAATSAAAAALGSRQIGVLEEGRAADLLVVDGEPLADVRDIRRIAMVFRAGRLVVDRRGELPEPVRAAERQ